jgi:paired amphipathic helix protein Sin3a
MGMGILQRCSTSYVRLPSNYPKMICGGRAHPPPGLETLAALLNDTWVSVTSGSEDYSFKVGPFPSLPIT